MYFEIQNEFNIDTIEELLSLSTEKNFGKPGKPISSYGQVRYENNNLVISPDADYFFHSTTGIFRGQSKNWDLIPTSYRDKHFDLDEEYSDIQIRVSMRTDNRDFFTFSEMASHQNHSFPKSLVEQMVIAQHYGIKTPLLDWTKNIFVAIYFSLDLKDEDDLDEKNFSPFIYHIRDERLLSEFIPDDKSIHEFSNSSFISPLPLDRRVERQFSVLTYHPHPYLKPKKVPVDIYSISEKIFFELWDMMKGMGFSSSHYFPDYAGLADRIKQGYMI